MMMAGALAGTIGVGAIVTGVLGLASGVMGAVSSFGAAKRTEEASRLAADHIVSGAERAATIAEGSAGAAAALKEQAGAATAARARLAGRAQQAEYKAEASQELFEARNEFITGQETAAALKARFVATVAGQQVAFARGGVMLGSGSAQAAQRQAADAAEREVASARAGSDLRELQRRRRAANLAIAGRNAVRAAEIEAANTEGIAKAEADLLRADAAAQAAYMREQAKNEAELTVKQGTASADQMRISGITNLLGSVAGALG